MPSLYSYVIPYDDGAAPNPHFGYCTLNICKPVIRRNAQKGDWVVATGSANSPIGDCRNKLVYAMEITEVVKMKAYDEWCLQNCPQKIVDWKNKDYRRRLGDAIYDFSQQNDNNKLRPSVHSIGNVPVDLGGENALISKHFYYFGNNPQSLPKHLEDIIKIGQGHKSISITHLLDPFINWITRLEFKPNVLHGKHQMDIFDDYKGSCQRAACAIEDENIYDEDINYSCRNS